MTKGREVEASSTIAEPAEASVQQGDASDRERTYTEAEVAKRLRGQAKELERYREAAQELEALKSQQAERNRKEAEKRGEYERLFQEAESRRKELESELERYKTTATAYESHVGAEVQEMLSAVADRETRKRWEALVEGQPVLEARRLLTELRRAAGLADALPPPPKSSPAGGRKADDAPDARTLARDPAARVAYATELLRKARESGAAK